MGWGRSATVARADLEFHALTGQAEIEYKRFFAGLEQDMSRQAVLAREGALATEKYGRTIAGLAPDSYAARRALVQYEREIARVERELAGLRHQQDLAHRSAKLTSETIVRSSRGAIAASGAFKGLGNALFFASGAFGGAFGLVYALRSTFEAAARAQVSIVGLSKAVRNAGLSWEANRDQIEKTIEAQSKMSAFDDEDLKDSLAGFVIRTKNVNDALKLNALAADIARARHIELDAAMRLVTRASLGQTSSLRRLGIDVEKVTTAQDRLRAAGVKVSFQQRRDAKAADDRATRLRVITQLEQKFGGQAAAFAQTAAGKQEYFNKVLEDTKEIIGTALLPTFTRLLVHFTQWLDKLNESGRLQKDINQDIKQAGYLFHTLAAFINGVEKAVEPLNRVLGGAHNTLKLVLGVLLAYKGLKIATEIRGMAEAWGLVGPAAQRAAAETVAAEAEIGTAATVATAKVGRLRTALGSLPTRIGITIYFAYEAYGPLKNFFEDKLGADYSGTTRAGSVMPHLNDAGMWVDETGKPVKNQKFWWDRARKILIQHGYSPEEADLQIAHMKSGKHGRPIKDVYKQGAKGALPSQQPGGGKAPRTELDIQLDISDAQRRNDESAEVRFDRELIALYNRQADRLRNRKNLTTLQKQRLKQLNDQIDQTQNAIETIISGQQSEARAKAAAAAAAARKKHQAHKDRVDAHIAHLENQALRAAQTAGVKDDRKWMRLLLHAYHEAAHDAELTAKEREAYEKKRLVAIKKIKTARATALKTRLDNQEKKLENAVEAAALDANIALEKKRLQKLIAFFKAEEHMRDLTVKAREEARRKELAARKKLKKLNDDAKKVGSQSGAEFLSSLQGVLNQYGGNLFGPGELHVKGRAGMTAEAAHTIIQTGLMRDQNAMIYGLTQQVRTPASSQGYTNMTSLFDGYATG